MVAFGDSVTMGATAVGKLERAAVHHHRLKGMFEARCPNCTFSVTHAGVGGDAATASLSRIDRDVRYQLDLVLVAFGLNDASESQEKLAEFAQSLRRIILDYSGNLDDSFEWAYWIGVANPHGNLPHDPQGVCLHSRPYKYRENPPVYTYRDPARVIATLKEVGGEMTGKPMRSARSSIPAGSLPTRRSSTSAIVRSAWRTRWDARRSSAATRRWRPTSGAMPRFRMGFPTGRRSGRSSAGAQVLLRGILGRITCGFPTDLASAWMGFHRPAG